MVAGQLASFIGFTVLLYLVIKLMTWRLARWLGFRGIDSRMEQLFVRSVNCCSGSRCHVHVYLFVCKRTHDTEEIPSVG